MFARVKRKISFLCGKILTPFYNILYKKKGLVCKGVLINCKIRICGQNNNISIGRGSVLRNMNISINGDNNRLIIGDNAKFVECGRIRMEDKNGEIRIGNNFGTSELFLTTADNNTKIIIGDDCMFSAKVIIRTSDAHSIINELTGERMNPGKDVIIGNHVWIGYGVNILKGSIVNDNSIVGTQSVVSGLTIPPNSLAAGVPAKIFKSNINWIEKRI